MKSQSKASDTFDPYAFLDSGYGYTVESVDVLIREYAARLSSIQSMVDSYRDRINELSEALNASEHNNDIMKHRMDAAVPQFFTSMKKLEALAFKDRPAMLIETGETFCYDIESRRWKQTGNASGPRLSDSKA